MTDHQDVPTQVPPEAVGDPGGADEASRSLPLSAVVMVVVIFLIPGGMFFAKGLVEVGDRVAGRTVEEGTVLSVAIEDTYTNKGRRIDRYEVRGVTAAGEPFMFDDRRVFELAEGQTPLAVRIERSRLSDRVIGLRTNTAFVDGVGGAARLPLAALALVLGTGFAVIPFLMPWQTNARKAAKKDGLPLPPPDGRALALVGVAAVLIVGGTLAWDLLR